MVVNFEEEVGVIIVYWTNKASLHGGFQETMKIIIAYWTKKAQENLHGGFQKTAKVIIAYRTEKAKGFALLFYFFRVNG